MRTAVVLFVTTVFAVAGCSSPATGPDPSAPSVAAEFGPEADSLYADLDGTILRIASDRQGVCVPPVSHVNPLQEEDDFFPVWMTDDIVPGCHGKPAVACFDLGTEFTLPPQIEVVLMLPLTAAPGLPLARGANARSHGPQCP